MDSEPRTSQFSAEQLAKLWNIGADAEAGPAGPDEQRAELLRDWMARPLPADADLRELLPEALGEACGDVRPFAGDPIGCLLTDPHTDVSVLERIKDLAKQTGTATNDTIEKDVALAVYFAAIAGARASHKAKISQHSDKKLRDAFDALAKQNWMMPTLVGLFEKASESKGPVE